MLIRVNSHRARRKFYQLVPQEIRGKEMFSWDRDGEFYRIPDEWAQEALKITGIKKAREGDDLRPCISFGGR